MFSDVEQSIEEPMDKDSRDVNPVIRHDNMSTPKFSFKNMVQGSHSGNNLTPSQVPMNPLFDNENMADEDSNNDLPPEDLDEDSKCPIILLVKEEKKRLRRPWKSPLIIKMFDKHIGLSYYVAKFSNFEDYNHVLLNGPWFIDGHYLTIRTWIPNFVPYNKLIKFLTAWVRIPNLSVEYFDTSFLTRVGSKIGRVIRIDKTTAAAERGKFTRLCVELDLSKPLLSKFWLKGKVWKIQYEGLRLICYNCGKINHREEDCPDILQQEQVIDDSHHEGIQQERENCPENVEDFGSWMLIKKTHKSPSPAQEKGKCTTSPTKRPKHGK
ncbi:hypothetical protein RDABS01_033541 [Bienertia sinuspersici]